MTIITWLKFTRMVIILPKLIVQIFAKHQYFALEEMFTSYAKVHYSYLPTYPFQLTCRCIDVLYFREKKGNLALPCENIPFYDITILL